MGILVYEYHTTLVIHYPGASAMPCHVSAVPGRWEIAEKLTLG